MSCGVLSLRFDDAPESDATVVEPELKARGLVGGFAVPQAYIGALGKLTLIQVLTLQAEGHEIMCHSRTHPADPATLAEFEDESVGAAEDMRAWGIQIRSWVQPGSFVVPYPGGFKINSASMYGSPPDVLLRSCFDAYESYIGATPITPPMSPLYRWGANHITAGTIDDAGVKAYIDDVATGKCGEILYHSAGFDQTGGATPHITTAEFTGQLDYIAAAVAAGTLLVVVPSAQVAPKHGYLAMRFEDGHATDVTVVLPELESRNLFAGFAVPRGKIDTSTYLSTAQCQALRAAGCEIMCKGRTGTTPANMTAFTDESVTAAAEMNALGLGVRSFVFPGGWSAGPYHPNALSFYGTDPDALLRAHFASYDGFIGVAQKPLPLVDNDRWGRNHTTSTALDLVTLRGIVDGLVTAQQQVELVFVSSAIDTPGNLSLADFQAFLDYLRDRVRLGLLSVVNPTDGVLRISAQGREQLPRFDDAAGGVAGVADAIVIEADDVLSLAAGDDYFLADSRSLDFLDDGSWPDLSGATLALAIDTRIFGAAPALRSGVQTVRAELNRLQTSLLDLGRFDFELSAILCDGDQVTLRSGVVDIVKGAWT